MKAYRVTGLWEMWDFRTLTVKAKDEKSAKAKFRKRINGSVTGLRAEVLP